MSLNGQWVTHYSGNNTGTLVIDVDDVGDHYEGVACVWDIDPEHPNSLVRFSTPSKANVQHLPNVPVRPIDNFGNYVPPAAIEQLKSNNFLFPETADIDFDFDVQGQNLSVNWKTPVGSFGGGTAIAPKTRAGQRSELQPLGIRTWDAFKKQVNKLDPKRYIFRGQESNEWRLRTSFYRTGRADLERYLSRDINDLQKSLSSLTNHVFDLTNNL